MSSATKEIVTIECGHYANFIGAHFWNFQESSFCFDQSVGAEINCINHDVLFREGKTLIGEFTYTPRLIAFDMKQKMGGLKKEGTLYASPDDNCIVTWFDDVVVQKTSGKNHMCKSRKLDSTEPTEDGESSVCEDLENDCVKDEKNINSEQMEIRPLENVNLDNSGLVWSDFLKTHFHPKTMILMDNNMYEDEENSCDSIIAGKTAAKQGSFLNELETKLHFFTEECDHLQGFQVLFDPYNKFAGIACRVWEEISDDFDTKASLAIGVTPTFFPCGSHLSVSYRTMSSVVSYSQVSDHASLLLPLSCSPTFTSESGPSVALPYLNYRSDLNYHTSAVLAALLDTSTMPLRSKVDANSLFDLCASLNYGQRKIASLVGVIPVPVSVDRPFIDYLMGLDALPFNSYSSLTLSGQTITPEIQQLVVRGISGALLKKATYVNLPRTLSSCTTSADVLQLYVNETMPNCKSQVRSFIPALNTNDPFPPIFDKKVGCDGSVSGVDRPEGAHVVSVPMITGLQSNAATGLQLKRLVTEAMRIDLKKHTGFFADDFEVDDYKECLENLMSMTENYHCSSEMSDDSDNDDA